MATDQFYLRPSADISVEHKRSAALAYAYAMINEEMSDGDSTYIYMQQSGTRVTATSQFSLSGNIPSGKFKVTGISITHKTRGNNDTTETVECFISVNGVNSRSLTFDLRDDVTYYYGYTGNVATDDLLNVINNNDSFPDITLTIITTSPTNKNNKNTIDAVAITQAYVEITYEEIADEEIADIGVHVKVNGEWVAAKTAYQKQSGLWVEIEPEQCKQILKSALCTTG